MERENLFTCNLDDDDSIIDREEFVIRKESPTLAAKGKQLTEELLGAVKKSIGKGIFIAALPYVFLVFGLLCIFLSVENYIESGELLVLPMLLGLFGLAAAGVAWMFSKRYEKKKEAEADGTVSSYDAAFDMYHKEQKAELAIPENTTELEIFTKAYSEEESETGGAYSNASVEAFQEGGNLCFFYSGAVIALPMDKIEALVKVDAPVIFDSWLKDVPYDRGNYMQYKIQMSEIDEIEERYTMQGYYSLRFTQGDSPFEIVIPLYEEEALSALIDMVPTKE